MSQLRLGRVWCGRLVDVTLELGPGLHVLIGAESDGTGELVELCAGVRTPRRGTVEVDGFPPSSSPACRRTIASLLPNERAPGGRSVERWLAELGARLGLAPQPLPAGLRLEPGRSLASLSGSEQRRLACHVALAVPNPRLVALHEPLAAVDPDARAEVLARIAELARERVVLVTTASLRDARELGGTTFRLDRGLLTTAPGAAWPGASSVPGLDVWLEVEADAPRALVSALAQHPDVRELGYHESRGGRVLLRGAELERLAEAVARAAVGARVDIRLLRALSDDLETGRAAATGRAHAAYRAARGHARQPAPDAPPEPGSPPALPGGTSP